MNTIYEATSSDAIQALLKKHQGITFLNFFSPTCGPCLMLEPILEQLVESGLITLIRVNVNENPEIVREYSVSAWPTNFIFKDGNAVQKIVGFQPIEEWKELLKTI